ncbi:MAG: hypothetical protein ACLQM8_18785 [Limisphaerales bacterium]
MKTTIGAFLLAARLSLLAGAAHFVPSCLATQLNPPVNPGPDAQRNALMALRSQVDWLEKSTRNAPSLGAGGYGLVWQRFESVRSAYAAFTLTLTAPQRDAGANDFAGLAAGLETIGKAFKDHQNEIGTSYPSVSSFRKQCRVLNRAMALWSKKLRTVCTRLRIAW